MSPQAVSSAKKFNKEHHVTEQISAVASATVAAAREANAKYQVTETAAAQVEAGWKELQTHVDKGPKNDK